MKDTTVVFDIGNVLLCFDHERICVRLAEKYQLEVSFIRRKIFGEGIEKRFDEGKITGEEFTMECAKALGVPLVISEFREIWSDIFWENTPVVEIAKELKPKSRLLILSNTNRWHIQHVRDKFDVLEHFDKEIFSYETGCRKPDRRIFDEIKMNSVGSAQPVYIDDIKDYIEKAEDLGIRGIHYEGDNEVLRKELKRMKVL